MKRLPDPTVPLGGLKHAVALLQWWANHQGNGAIVREMQQQSKECRRELLAALRRFEKRRTP
jgi:hypothetical protein